MRKLWLIFSPVFYVVSLCGQPSLSNTVTRFPSLLIPPSARGLAMGDGGIATAKENQQLYYNAAATAFTRNFHQASFSYLPWLTGISQDTRLMGVNYLASITDGSAFGVSLNYLRLGSIDLRDENGATLASYPMREFNIGLSYALQVAEHQSLGVTMKFLGQNQFAIAPTSQYRICGDLSYYGYLELANAAKKLHWGITLSNLMPGYQLPQMIGAGIGYSSISSNDDQLTLSLDATRLLQGVSPGIRFTTGLEYGFEEQFFLRSGMSLEKQGAGNRKFFSFGAGYKGYVSDQTFGLDLYYLVPFGTVSAVSPFQHSWGMTLHLSFGNFQ
ncbi:MAG TPA: PorV/PorQ family protein [Sediminibacterium sp.]|nr:PorV/PorQ family protein [Sediminibacterium sp.]